MRKILFLLIASLVLFSTLSAQITQNEADSIVQQRISDETRPYTVYAKENIQPEGTTIATVTGELLELDYPCWVYYVSYTGETFGKYLMIKESNGNLLEVNTKNDSGPSDLAEWKKVTFEPEYPIDIPFIDYYMDDSSPTLCWANLIYPYDGSLVIIDDNAELKDYFKCMDDYPVIDFSKYTLLVASGNSPHGINKITKQLTQIGKEKYNLNIDIVLGWNDDAPFWEIAILIPIISQEAVISLNVIQYH